VTSSERDHRTRREHFPSVGKWWSWIYLAQIRRYGASKIFGSRVWPFGVTRRHQSRNHWTPHVWFPIGGPLKSSIYLAPLRRYGAPKILGSRPWPFGVTWRHRSRDHRTRRGYFPIGGQWWPCVYLARIRRYGASKILGSRVWPFGVTWRHRSRDHWTRHMWFPIGGPLEPCIYLAPLRKYKASKLHLPMLKAKSSLRMLRVTWPIGRGGGKMTTYLEFPSLYCLFTIQLVRLRWRLRVVCRWICYTEACFSRQKRCACPVSRDLWVGGLKWPHIWNSWGHIAYSLYNFYGPTMTIMGRL